MQSSLAKTLAERAAADTAGDTHEILRSVLVDDFYGASAVFSFLNHDAGFTSECTYVRAPEIDKWHRRGEYQPAVGVLLLTQGVDGNDGTGL